MSTSDNIAAQTPSLTESANRCQAENFLWQYLHVGTSSSANAWGTFGYNFGYLKFSSGRSRPTMFLYLMSSHGIKTSELKSAVRTSNGTLIALQRVWLYIGTSGGGCANERIFLQGGCHSCSPLIHVFLHSFHASALNSVRLDCQWQRSGGIRHAASLSCMPGIWSPAAAA